MMSSLMPALKRLCGGKELEAPQAKEAATNTSPDLSVALQHPALSSSPQVLCAAARACKAWRQAVQQCGVCNTAVTLNLTMSLQRLQSFVQWLPKHAVLVRSISTKAGDDSPGLHFSDEQQEADLEAAQQLLAQALQAAADQSHAGTADTAPAAAASNAAGANNRTQQQQQQQRGWRLASFSSDVPGAPDLLQFLPAHSLTYLHLQLRDEVAAQQASAQLSQLVRLSSLQQLWLHGSMFSYELPDGCVANLAQLSQLTSLKLTGVWQGVSEQLQQLLAQPLPLQQLHVSLEDECNPTMALPSLDHLTQLTDLHVYCAMARDAVLPAQLHTLYLRPCSEVAPILALQQLQRLTFWPVSVDQQQLLQLAALPALQELDLKIQAREATQAAEAAAAAPAWALLPQLRGLAVWLPSISQVSTQHMADILAGAAAATQLTSLHIRLVAERVPLNQEQGMPICGQLAGLVGLQDLVLTGPCLVPGDAAALTKLTQLTSLVLSHMHGAVGEVEGTALAGSLTGLRHLDMRHCGVDFGRMEFMAAVGQLTQLTYLCLDGKNGLTQKGLFRQVRQLTGLSRLQQLDVVRYDPVVDWQVVQQQESPAGRRQQSFWRRLLFWLPGWA